MAEAGRTAQEIRGSRLESVMKAVVVTLILMTLVGIVALVYIAKRVDAGAPRSAVEYRLRRAQDLVKTNPTDATAWLSLGAAESDAGMYGRAIVSLEKVIEAQPANETAWFELGVAYRRSGDRDSAIEAYETALKTAQDSLLKRRAELEQKGITQPLVLPDAGALSCIALAELYVETGDLDKARASAMILVEDNPIDTAGLIALAEVEEAAGNTQAAIDAYRSAQEYLPSDAGITAALKRLGAE